MSDKKPDVKMEDIVSLCKRRGFIFQGSEIYGGLAGTWDYGPLGVALKKNIMNLWWKMFVEDRDDMYGVDAAILMNQKVWQASGHVDTFTDPLVECSNCKSRFRADHLVDLNGEEFKSWHENIFSTKATKEIQEAEKLLESEDSPVAIAGQSALINHYKRGLKDPRDLFVVQDFMNEKVKCEKCSMKTWDRMRPFNMMFKTYVGPTSVTEYEEPPSLMDPVTGKVSAMFGDDQEALDNPEENAYETVRAYSKDIAYLRPETAQGIFTNYKNVVDTFYPDMPFGLAQQGKAFRNEISPRDFVFRSREFEQMEIEYFVHPDKWEAEFENWVKNVYAFLDALGIPKANVHELEVPESDRAHYSKRTIDFEFDFPHRKDELLGLAYRTDFDLMNIQNASGKSMDYRPKDGGDPYVPHVIEPSFGVDRAIMAVLTSAYTEDEVNGEARTYLKLPAHLAPVRVAVSPLLKNKPELVAKAKEVYDMLKKEFGNVMYDDNGNIGKRYRRQDEIGTPYCIVIDFDTLEDNTVTIRNRDTTKQERIKINEITRATEV